MKTKHWTTVAIVMSCLALASTGFAQDAIEFSTSTETDGDSFELVKKVKDAAIWLLTWILGPVVGGFTAFKGWQMIGNSQRGEKGPGVVVFLCGIGLFALPKIINEIVGYINT